LAALAFLPLPEALEVGVEIAEEEWRRPGVEDDMAKVVNEPKRPPRPATASH